MKKIILVVFLIVLFPCLSIATTLMIGDSLMEDAGPFISKTLGGDSVQAGKRSTGLVRKDYYDWAEHLNVLMNKYHPTQVIICIGTNDNQSIKDVKHIYNFGTQEWDNIYKARIIEINNIILRHNAVPIWIGMPQMPQKINIDIQHIKNLIHIVNGNNFIDTWTVFSGMSSVRTSDGVHLTTKGNKIFANYVSAQIERRFIDAY